MLLWCSIENWMSFRDRVSFSMIASKERQHKRRVAQISKYKLGVLPIAAVYGGNASGKTNFFKALWFAQEFVVRGTQPGSIIPVEPFRLDNKKMAGPSFFSFELLIDDEIYELSFWVTYNRVVEEKLVRILATSEKVLYERKNGKLVLDKSFEDDKELQFAFNGTRDNQLFLTNSVSQKKDNFRSVYDWFKDNLVLIGPDHRFGFFEYFFDEGHALYKPMNTMLAQLDTGIAHLGSEELDVNSPLIPEMIKMKIRGDLLEGVTYKFISPITNDRIIVTRKNGQIIVKKLVTYHRKLDGGEIKFEVRQESDGSQRLIDLLPAFIPQASVHHSKKVFVIDEIDRSLHAVLTRRLLEIYLSGCSHESRTQLLFTTHDVFLMDQDLLRRDEMWIAERDVNGASQLVSFSEFKDVRYDKDIRKSYLQGRLGGIPRILLSAIRDTAS